MSTIAKHIIVKGKVQGVFFRKHTEKKALELKLQGWVKNTDEGNVEIFVQGEKDTIEKLVKWCWQGSPKSEVTNVEISDADTDERMKDFTIHR